MRLSGERDLYTHEIQIARTQPGMLQCRMHKGFTLVEVAVVLVIIALIVGGILVGRDLVAAAGLRATIGQIEDYDAAVQAFRTKYGGLPGDLSTLDADALGLFTFDNGLDLGNANGVLDLADPANDDGQFSGEAPAFWRHLSETGLIAGIYGVVGNNAIVESTGFLTDDVTDVQHSIPPARLGRGNYVTAYSSDGANYFEINGIAQISQLGEYTVHSPGLLPSEAAAIDAKIDDGISVDGRVIARGGFNITGALNRVPSGSECIERTHPSPYPYLIASQTASCALRVRITR